MTVDLILLGILLAALGVMTTIVVRKFPALRTLPSQFAADDPHAAVKTELIARRLRRKLGTAAKQVDEVARPVFARIQALLTMLVRRIEQLEREYRHRAKALVLTSDDATAQRIDELLEEAMALRRDDDLVHAEQHYIEAISLSPTNVRAFQGLGELYLEQKEYAQAEETLLHTLKLDSHNDGVLLDLANVHRAAGDIPAALRRCQQAVDIHPNDPKNLNALLEVSIIAVDRSLAERTLEQLELVNPENQKLEQLRTQVAALPPQDNPPVRKQARMPM